MANTKTSPAKIQDLSALSENTETNGIVNAVLKITAPILYDRIPFRSCCMKKPTPLPIASPETRSATPNAGGIPSGCTRRTNAPTKRSPNEFSKIKPQANLNPTVILENRANLWMSAKGQQQPVTILAGEWLDSANSSHSDLQF